jgi:hypothetical protein
LRKFILIFLFSKVTFVQTHVFLKLVLKNNQNLLTLNNISIFEVQFLLSIFRNEFYLTKKSAGFLKKIPFFKLKMLNFKKALRLKIKKKFKKITLTPRRTRRFYLYKSKWLRYKYVLNRHFFKKKRIKHIRNNYFYLYLSHYMNIKNFKKNKYCVMFNKHFSRYSNVLLNNCNINLEFYFNRVVAYSYIFLKKNYISGKPTFFQKFFLKKNMLFKITSKKPDLIVLLKFFKNLKKKSLENNNFILADIGALQINAFKKLGTQFFFYYTDYFSKVFFFKPNYCLARFKKRRKRSFKKFSSTMPFKFLKQIILLNFIKTDVKFMFTPYRATFSSFFNYFFFNKHFKNNLILKTTPSTNFNNRTPIQILPISLKRLVFKKFQKNFTPNYYKYIYYYISSYLEFFTKKKIFLRLKSKIKAPELAQDVFMLHFNKHKYFQSKVGRGFFFIEMLEII